jgi:streptogramin lyase
MEVEYSGESVVAIKTVGSEGGTIICGLYYFIPMCMATPIFGGSTKARFVSTRPLLPGTASGGLVTTLAGAAGISGSSDGTGSSASFKSPAGVATDVDGNVYVADTDNHIIRKITPAGIVTTLAGSPGTAGSDDGPGAAARFNFPGGVATDGAGNVYVADTLNSTVRKISAAGVVSTLAGTAGAVGDTDGVGAAACFNLPSAITTDGAGNLYVADSNNNAIRKITPRGVVTTLAGPNAWGVEPPSGIAADRSGNVYVTARNGNAIRKITPGGAVTTLALQPGARFNFPNGLAIDSAGILYVADTDNHAVRKVTPEGVVTTLAGPIGAGLKSPVGVATDGAGNVYVADTGSGTIRKIARSATASP